MQTMGDFFPDRVNMHFRNAKYAADVRDNGIGKIYIPAVETADADGILDGQAIATAQDLDTSDFAAAYSDDVMGKFGRNITVVGSAASTATITVYGYDYLGQPMIEEIDMNGTTPVAGVKAFARVTRIVTGTDADSTLDVGWGDVLGLPYGLVDLITELVDEAEPADAGTVVKRVTTDPQTATTGDPRGTYAPHSNNAPNGSRTYQLVGLWAIEDLFGVAHYNG